MPPPLEPAGLLPHHFPVPSVVRAAPFPVAVPPFAAMFRQVPRCQHSWRAPSSSSPISNQERVCFTCRGGCFATTVVHLGVISLWFHGPAVFEELHSVLSTLVNSSIFWCMIGQVPFSHDHCPYVSTLCRVHSVPDRITIFRRSPRPSSSHLT